MTIPSHPVRQPYPPDSGHVVPSSIGQAHTSRMRGGRAAKGRGRPREQLPALAAGRQNTPPVCSCRERSSDVREDGMVVRDCALAAGRACLYQARSQWPVLPRRGSGRGPGRGPGRGQAVDRPRRCRPQLPLTNFTNFTHHRPSDLRAC
jgi:hypothetical protein